MKTNLPSSTNKFSLRLPNLKQKAFLSLLTPNTYISKKIVSLANRVEDLKWKNLLRDAGIPNVNEILTYTSMRELRALYQLASNCPQGTIALEIGSHLGASSCYIAAGLSQNNGHLFCIDTWQNETMPEGQQDTFPEFQKNTYGVKRQISSIRKRSNRVSNQDIKIPINLVFIDGDHSY